MVDHHCHLSPNGEGVAAARRFSAAGGTHLFLTTQNYLPAAPRSVDEYRTQFETTETLARTIRAETGVEVYVVVAPYPVDLVTTSPALGVPAALELQRRALDLAGTWVKDHRAVALGEVGLPHFEVAPELAEAASSAFDHALAVARDVACPVVVHSADLTPQTYRELALRGARSGMPPGKIVKHYARNRLLPDERAGIVPSYLARRDLVREVVHDPGPWFLETDFLDDPARPGAVLDLATVPRRALAVAEASPGGAEQLRIPFVDAVEKVYGWRPELPARRRA
ncbi:MAG TPA: TatD family hydrolase [Thermoplasmata archaeon]|nr:TatD family hydrolase [Thermoplasmata archaeon]